MMQSHTLESHKQSSGGSKHGTRIGKRDDGRLRWERGQTTLKQQKHYQAAAKPTSYDKLDAFQKYIYGNLCKLNAKVKKRDSVLRSSDFNDQAPRSWLCGSPSSHELARQWKHELKRHGGDTKEEEATAGAKHGPSLLRAIWHTYGLSYLVVFVFVILSDLVCEPAFFHLCIRLIELIGELVFPGNDEVRNICAVSNRSLEESITAERSVDDTIEQLYSTALVFLVAIISYQLLTHPYAWLNHKMGLRMRVALSEMIYKKSLQTKQANCEQSLNLITRDLESLEARFLELSWIFAGSLQCLVFTVIVSQRLDMWTTLVAFILNFSSASQRSVIHFRLRKYNRLASGVADRRVNLIGETIDAIRLVRMYGWTGPLEAKIERNRHEEMEHRKRQLAARGFDVALFFITASAASLLALMFGYYVRGLPMTQSMVSQLFLLTATYRRALTRNLADGMQAWVQFLVAIERCQAYLIAPNKPGGDWTASQDATYILDRNGAMEALKPLKAIINDEHEVVSRPSPICQLNDVCVAWHALKMTRKKDKAREGDDSERELCLRHVNMTVCEGELILVAGHVGSGKSTLLQLLLGELAPTSGSLELKPGIEVAFASQEAWIFSGTVRENIILGRTFDLERYYQVLRVCALVPDLCVFPDFDRTRVGERAVTLSGGQKARINLARALYQRADLYLLDDPLSAVDSHVSSHIFNEALRGYLRNKTVILVTHQVQYLNQVDKILYLSSEGGSNNDKEVTTNFFGPYDEFEKLNLLDELLASSQEHSKTHQGANSNHGELARHSSLYQDNGNKEGTVDRNWVMDRILFNRFDESMRLTAISPGQTGGAIHDEMFEISESRHKNHGRVRTSKMSRAVGFYLNNAGKPLEIFWFALVNILMRCLFLSLNIFLNFWAGFQVWTQLENGSGSIILGNQVDIAVEKSEGDNSNSYGLNWISLWIAELNLEGTLAVAGLIWLCIVLVSLIRTVQFYTLTARAGLVVHRQLIHSLLWTKLSFFDRTPQGHLINRLAADISHMDTSLINQMDQITVTGLSMVFVFVGIVMSVPKMALVVCALALLTHWVFKYLADLMELIKYLDGFRRAKLYSHVGATIKGLAIIRSSNQSDWFIQTFNQLLDEHTSVRFLIISMRRFIIGIIDWILILFYTSLVVFIVRETLNGNGLYAFVSLNLVVQLTRIAQKTLVTVVEFHLSVQSMDRIREYATGLEHERLQLFGPYIDSDHSLKTLAKTTASKTTKDGQSSLHKNELMKGDDGTDELGLKEAQISKGAIRFSGVSLKFLHTNKLVLDNVSFYIEPGTKVGILGRTGAGKSSLATSLFHLYHFEGFIYIDGQDTKQLQLDSLRSSISIIPQDPCLFSGSIRHNLDPFEMYSDDKLWHVLDVVRLKQLVQSNLLGLEMLVHKFGSNFSIGQRQLICLARAILNENTILVMDEATSNIDQETDSLIQLAIKNQFKSCTVLTIAHRLSTVIELDKLMIMQDGQLVEYGTPKELLERGSNGLLCGLIESAGEQQAPLLRSKIARSDNLLFE